MKLKFELNKFLIIITSFLLNFFHLFKINSKNIIFISFDGKQISCSPKYIYEYILGNYDNNYKLFWVLTNTKNVKRNNKLNIIKKGTVRYYYLMLTSKYIITNDRISAFLPIRKEQILINTWHGGGLFKKNFGKNICLKLKSYIDWLNIRDANRTKLYLSSGEEWTRVVLRSTFNYQGEVCNSGMPRNDLLLNSQKNNFVALKKKIGISEQEGVILYAPTYRKSSDKNSEILFLENPIDVNCCINYWNKKENKVFHFLYRGHHMMSNFIDNENIHNVSDYPDMQELLLLADVFISDFSSSLYDFSLTKKPCFIYAPDFSEYVKEPGFESDYKEWPFTIAKSNSELLYNMINFNPEEYLKKVEVYHNDLRIYDNGLASKFATEVILLN